MTLTEAERQQTTERILLVHGDRIVLEKRIDHLEQRVLEMQHSQAERATAFFRDRMDPFEARAASTTELLTIGVGRAVQRSWIAIAIGSAALLGSLVTIVLVVLVHALR